MTVLLLELTDQGIGLRIDLTITEPPEHPLTPQDRIRGARALKSCGKRRLEIGSSCPRVRSIVAPGAIVSGQVEVHVVLQDMMTASAAAAMPPPTASLAPVLMGFLVGPAL